MAAYLLSTWAVAEQVRPGALCTCSPGFGEVSHSVIQGYRREAAPGVPDQTGASGSLTAPVTFPVLPETEAAGSGLPL